MQVLYNRNKDVFRADTLRTHTRTICYRLVVSSVLKDLRKSENYRNLTNESWRAYRKKAFINPLFDEDAIKDID